MALPWHRTLTLKARISSRSKSSTRPARWPTRITFSMSSVPGRKTAVDSPAADLQFNTQGSGDLPVIAAPQMARGVKPVTMSVTGTLPPTSTVDPTTGNVTVNPQKLGNYQFAFVLQDATGRTLTLNWNVTEVEPPPQPTTTISVSPASATVGQSLTVKWSSTGTTSCTASGGGANGSAWSGSVATSGSVAQTATTVGQFTYTVACVGPRRYLGSGWRAGRRI